jgi:hypothetical protein
MYEYTRYIRPIDVEHLDPLPADPIVELANRLARENWELVTATQFETHGLPHVLLTFRRQASIRGDHARRRVPG